MVAQASPGPGARALFVITGITVLLSAIPVVGGALILFQAASPVRAVTVPVLMDPRATPGGSFVNVSIAPDAAAMSELSGDTSAYLLGARDDRRLVLYVPSGTDLYRTLQTQVPPSSTVDARIWDLGGVSHLSSDMDVTAVDQEVATMYGARVPSGVRVLEVGATPGSVAFIGALTECCCGVPLLLLAVFAAFRGFRAMLAGRP